MFYYSRLRASRAGDRFWWACRPSSHPAITFHHPPSPTKHRLKKACPSPSPAPLLLFRRCPHGRLLCRFVTSVDTFHPFSAPKPSSGLFRGPKSPPDRSSAAGRHRGHWRCSWLGFETVPRLPAIHHWRLGISSFSSFVGPLVISRAVIAPPRTLGALGPADYRSPAGHL